MPDLESKNNVFGWFRRILFERELVYIFGEQMYFFICHEKGLLVAKIYPNWWVIHEILLRIRI